MNRREILMQMAGLSALALASSPSWAADDGILDLQRVAVDVLWSI